MKLKAIVKITIDIFMTLLLLFLMGYQFWGDIAHEWAGAGIFVLFILHHILNKNWYKTLMKGTYSATRIFQLAINILVFLSMVGLMISGIMLSRHVFDFLPIKGSMSFARMLHMVSAYWGFVLMALHMGLYWNMAVNRIKNIMESNRCSALWFVVFRFVGIVVAVYGLYAFVKRNLLTYMLLRTQFVFMDFNEPILMFYLDYLAIMGLFIYIAYYVSKWLRMPKKEKSYHNK